MRLAGRNAEITMKIGAGTALIVPMASYSVNMEADRTDATNFGDANKVEVQGLPALSGDFSGFFDSEKSFQLFAAQASSAPVTLEIFPDKANFATEKISGPAWISASLNQTVNGAVEVSGSFSAAGTWDLSSLQTAWAVV